MARTACWRVASSATSPPLTTITVAWQGPGASSDRSASRNGAPHAPQ